MKRIYEVEFWQSRVPVVFITDDLNGVLYPLEGLKGPVGQLSGYEFAPSLTYMEGTNRPLAELGSHPWEIRGGPNQVPFTFGKVIAAKRLDDVCAEQKLGEYESKGKSWKVNLSAIATTWKFLQNANSNEQLGYLRQIQIRYEVIRKERNQELPDLFHNGNTQWEEGEKTIGTLSQLFDRILISAGSRPTLASVFNPRPSH